MVSDIDIHILGTKKKLSVISEKTNEEQSSVSIISNPANQRKEQTQVIYLHNSTL